MNPNRLKGIAVTTVFVGAMLVGLALGTMAMGKAIDKSRVKLSPTINRVLNEEIQQLEENLEKSDYLKVSK
ncbi:hypothetical protein HYT84_04205 [Candidatus Micrarchaeota archaeon]|nr:hypothetical protein [Candidatus Micrarchaeota archaeon]